MSPFYQWFSIIHFPSQRLFSERAFDFRMYLYYNKNVGSPFFKVFLKNFAKLTEIYICRRLFSDEVEGCSLKGDFGAGAFLLILLNF